ncbi:PP2C family serine/threonine-protein phosphatase [Thermococcus sp.]|uniref:PP2C family serine/threonine-protein phosphatase n=1 Tax=Thermococcus sp. TaxID=35749 RepID=UPI0025E5AE62|nr:PP2C family serine/threonine-protein phosphatase [Thermococcus sp.]
MGGGVWGMREGHVSLGVKYIVWGISHPGGGEKNGEVKGFLLRAYGKTHYRIEEVSSKPTRVGMALVSAFIRDGQMVTTSTGDGRAYLIRDGNIILRMGNTPWLASSLRGISKDLHRWAGPGTSPKADQGGL